MKHNRKATAKTQSITGVVRCYQDISTSVHITNNVGGTAYLPVGYYRVRLLESWYDDETGMRCIGELLDPKDIETARKAGTTRFTPEDYRKYGQKRYEETAKAAREFNPARIHFYRDDFTADPLPRSNAARFPCRHQVARRKGPSKHCMPCSLADEALKAFWEVIDDHFPDATTGDLSPERGAQLFHAAGAAIEEWISNNVPEQNHDQAA
jgi:hypothetical protein